MTVAYHGRGFSRFFDRLMLHGLEFMGLFYGVYRAQVVDNADAQGQGRIKIRCPAIGDTENTPGRLAYPDVPFAGKDYGMKFLPPTGGHCYVTFECGRPDTPLWHGGWWARGDIGDDLKGVDQHWIRTPGDHLLLLDDTDGSKTVKLRHSNGVELMIDNDGNITITNVNGKVVTVGAGSNEAAVLGDTWKSLIEQLIDAILVMTHPTSVGPTGIPINAVQFQAVKAQLQTALSKTVKIAK